MSYWHQMYPKQQRSERVEVPNGEARFEALMAKDLKDGDRKFAESMQNNSKTRANFPLSRLSALTVWNSVTPRHLC